MIASGERWEGTAWGVRAGISESEGLVGEAQAAPVGVSTPRLLQPALYPGGSSSFLSLLCL